MLPPDEIATWIDGADWLTEWSRDRAPTRGAYGLVPLLLALGLRSTRPIGRVRRSVDTMRGADNTQNHNIEWSG